MVGDGGLVVREILSLSLFFSIYCPSLRNGRKRVRSNPIQEVFSKNNSVEIIIRKRFYHFGVPIGIHTILIGLTTHVYNYDNPELGLLPDVMIASFFLVKIALHGSLCLSLSLSLSSRWQRAEFTGPGRNFVWDGGWKIRGIFSVPFAGTTRFFYVFLFSLLP